MSDPLTSRHARAGGTRRCGRAGQDKALKIAPLVTYVTCDKRSCYLLAGMTACGTRTCGTSLRVVTSPCASLWHLPYLEKRGNRSSPAAVCPTRATKTAIKVIRLASVTYVVSRAYGKRIGVDLSKRNAI